MDGAPLEAPAEKAERGVCCMIALRQLVPQCSADPESEPVVVDGVAAAELPAGTLLHLQFGGSAADVEESDVVVQQQQRLTDFSEVGPWALQSFSCRPGHFVWIITNAIAYLIYSNTGGRYKIDFDVLCPSPR